MCSLRRTQDGPCTMGSGASAARHPPRRIYRVPAQRSRHAARRALRGALTGDPSRTSVPRGTGSPTSDRRGGRTSATLCTWCGLPRVFTGTTSTCLPCVVRGGSGGSPHAVLYPLAIIDDFSLLRAVVRFGLLKRFVVALGTERRVSCTTAIRVGTGGSSSDGTWWRVAR